MEKNEVLETQLLVHAMQEPSVAKQVLARNYTTLLSDEKDKNIAKVLIKYYNGSSVPISEDLLRSHVSKMLSDTNRIRSRKGQPELTTEDENDYYSRALDIYNSSPDRSDDMMHDVDKYIHDKLTATAFIEESALGEDDIGNRAIKRMTEINNISIRGVANKPIDLFKDTEIREKVYSEEYIQNKVPFGIAPFDELTRGGLKKGQLGLFAAPQGKGKTTILTNLAYYMSLAGNNVLYYTLEELTSDSMLRLDRLISGASINDAMTKKGEIKPEFVSKVNNFIENGAKKKYKGHGLLTMAKARPNEITLDDVRQTIVSMEQDTGKRLDVVILDYADLLKKSSNTLGYEAQAGERLFQNIVNLAQEQDIVILTGAQLNRDNGNAETKTLENVEGAYRKKNVLALGMTLNRNDAEYAKGEFRLYIDKVRNNYGYNDKFLYLKYNLKNMLMLSETDSEIAEHKAISGSDSSKKVDVKRDKGQSMNEAIEDSMTNKINDTLAQAFK